MTEHPQRCPTCGAEMLHVNENMCKNFHSTKQHPQRIFWKSAKPDDFKNAELLDWIEGVGEITTQYELNFIRAFGCASHSTGKQEPQLQVDSFVIFDERFSQWLAVNYPQLSFEKHAEIVEAAVEVAGDIFPHNQYPIPGDEQCRICSRAVRQDEREKVLDELKGIIDGAISQLFTGTEDVVSAHARHKALAWVRMKIEELRQRSDSK